jgi:diguanylate cyclase (GGDEF)-like protein
VAGSITSTVRGGDLAARWGGEEFLVLLPQTDLEQARRAAERLRAAVEALRAPGLPCITVSGGVARLEPADSVTELLDRADRNLYAAKAAGRNCTR